MNSRKRAVYHKVMGASGAVNTSGWGRFCNDHPQTSQLDHWTQNGHQKGIGTIEEGCDEGFDPKS